MKFLVWKWIYILVLKQVELYIEKYRQLTMHAKFIGTGVVAELP